MLALSVQLSGTLSSAGVSINITGDVSDQSAMLDVQSTDKGLLIQDTDAQRNELSPVQGYYFTILPLIN